LLISAPVGEEDDLVLDFGTMHDLYGGGRRDELVQITPGRLLRSIGMGELTSVARLFGPGQGHPGHD